jgi:UPF0755 protein
MGRHRTSVILILFIFVLVALVIAVAVIPRKSDHRMVSFIVKRGTKVDAVARGLKNEDLVRSRYLFALCAFLLYKGRVVAGEYELSKDLSIVQIARKMAHGERRIYTLRIVEGYNLYTVGDAIQKAGIMDRLAFLELAKNGDFLRKLSVPADTLEGFLFPDTYFFSKETDVDEFLGKIVERTFKFFEKDDIRLQMDRLGVTMFETLSLASIIEKEAKLESEKPLISAVFHNRLRLGMTLDADPTVIYGQSSFARNLTKKDLLAHTPYNTYRQKGLPKGPICSPSKGSIVAALYPEKTDVLYFVSRNDGSHVFSRTIKEHTHYVAMYQRNKTDLRRSEEAKKRRSGKINRPAPRRRTTASS